MRLHTLELQAFGPYATPQQIDFDLLASSGLFLLEGPTGAGKSMILDALTFALYGGLAGEEQAQDRLRSHFAAPDAEPSVRLEFSVQGARYRVTRIPEHLRPKKRGGGFTPQHSQVHLERMEAAGWSSLSSNKAEAAELITEAIGLNREQFTQVILLPQGEFARFLRARDDDRRELLTKLFGTQLYDRVIAELERRRTDASREREQAERQVSDAVSAAAEAAGLDTGTRTGLLAMSRADRETAFKEAAERIAADLAVTRAGLDVAASDLARARAADEQAKQQAALMTRLTQALAALRAHLETRPEHDQQLQRLASARRAEPVRPLLAGLADAQALAAEAREALLAVAEEPDADMLAGRGGSEAAARAEAAGREAAALQHLAGRETELATQEAAVARLELHAEQAAARATDLAEARGRLSARVLELDGEWRQARSAAAGLAALTGRREAVVDRQLATGEAADLAPQVAAARSALQAAVDAHQALVDLHQGLYEARLSEMAAELAARLADGCPCPVCGATEHPAPAHPSAQAVSAGDIEAAARRRDEAEAERSRLDAEHAELTRKEAALLARAGGRTASDLAAEAETLAGDIAAAERAAAAAGELEAELTVTRGELEANASELRAAAEQATAANEQARAKRDSLADLRAELAAAAGEFPSVAARRAGLRAAADRDRALAHALGALAAALDGQAKARDRAGHEAARQGFAGLDTAREAVLETGAMADLDRTVESWRSALTDLQAAAHMEDLAGLDPARAGEIHAHAAAAAAELIRAQDAEQEVRRAHDATRAQAERLRQRALEVQEAEEACDRLAEATEPVIRLAGLAKGTEGHRRVNLTTYVLRHWFSQVVAAGNGRLSAMSAGRYELKRTDEGGSRRERSGLTLAVIDRHTGEERSPASLSGGETFYTSLALALGLADVVKAEAGGVDLDTLFIDEGFGSLDAGTLDQVMAVIDDLRDRGRVVGIVSHVADLKDRVPERLEVRRRPDGSSAVKVVA